MAKLFFFVLFILALVGCGKSNEGNLFSNPFQYAILEVEEASRYDFGTVLVQNSAEKIFTILNVGQQPASSIGGAFTISAFRYKGGNYPGVGGTCGNTLAPQQTCTVIISFEPSYADNFSEVFALNYHNGMKIELVSLVELSGKGAGSL